AVGVYLLLAFVVFQLVLWPLAVFDLGSPLRQVAADALRTLLRRPLQALALGLALLAVNVLGAAVLLPFTLTIAYTFLAAVRFSLPPTATEAREQWPA